VIITTTLSFVNIYPAKTKDAIAIRKQIVIITQIVEPRLILTNNTEIGGANIMIKFKLLGPKTSNFLITNMQRAAEMLMRHRETTRACIYNVGHNRGGGIRSNQ
jgi:hypothetical protein